MPRQPVKPQDRRRVARACEQCKASKKRCNGVQPCNTCKKKSQHGFCHYTAGWRHHALPHHSSSSARMSATRLASDGDATNGAMLSPNSTWGFQGAGAISSGTMDDSSAEGFRQQGYEDIVDDDMPESPTGATNLPPVMLSSMSGEKGQWHSAIYIERYRWRFTRMLNLSSRLCMCLPLMS